MGKVREDLTKETVSEELLGRKPFSKEFFLLNILINPYFIRCFAFFPICWRWNRISLCFNLLPCLLVGLVILPHTHAALSLPYIHIWSLRFPFQLISGWFPACFSVQLSFFFFFNCVCGGGLSLLFGGGVLKFWIWILYWWYAFNILSQPMTCLFT